jgi:S1-C subfamily serine protease
MNDTKQNRNRHPHQVNFPFANLANTNIANEMASIAERLQRCTVQIKDSYGGSGSGVVWNDRGLIISNAHVVRSRRATITLSDHRVLEAISIAREPGLDLVALHLSQTVDDLPHAIAGNSDNLRVGELVLAVGNPLGIVGALNTGIVTTTAQAIDSSNVRGLGHVSMEPTQLWIVSDVQLAPGNSGGLLADARGRVVGINTMIVNGLALAVPSNTVEKFILSLSMGETHQFNLNRRSGRRARIYSGRYIALFNRLRTECSSHPPCPNRSDYGYINRYRNNTPRFVGSSWFVS